jgi:hypothetical protein
MTELDAVAKAHRLYDRMSSYDRRVFRSRHSATLLKKTTHAGMRFDEVPEGYLEYLQKPSTTVFRDELKNLILWHLCEDD